MINDLKTKDEWNIQLSIAVNFFSCKNTSQAHVIRSKIDNKKIMKDIKTNEIIQEIIGFLLKKEDLEESMKGREFVFDDVDLLHLKCHRENPKSLWNLYRFA